MIPVRNVYYLLCYAWRYLEETELVDRAALDELDQVHDLFGKVLAEGTFRLVRRGLDRGYQETTEEIPGVRGKLEVGAMATTAVRARGRTICTYEVFTPDVLHNRILRSTLQALLRIESLDRRVRRDVALANQKLEGVSTIRVTRQAFRRIELNRTQRHYKFLLEVCRLIHESLLVREETGEVEFRDFRRSKKTMWRVFEDFAREFYRVEQDAYDVLRTRQIRWNALSGRTVSDQGYVPDMYSDILLEGSGRRIILDTKFYRRPLSRRYGSDKLRSKNLYQLLAYLENRQANAPEGPRHEGILLYAAVDQSFSVDLMLRGYRIQARSVDLSQPFQLVREEMLGVLGIPSATETVNMAPAGSAAEHIRVEREPGRTVIMARRIRWEGPHTPVSTWHDAESLPRDASDRDIQTAIASVLEDPDIFRVCAACGERQVLGHMHDEKLCQGCAETQLGVVY